MYLFYQAFTHFASPFIPALLKRRQARGKEDAGRLPERLGFASLARPEGRLLWIHAASVGESNSVLPLIQALLASFPSLHILLTTVTVTSANMMRGRLPDKAFHQFAVVDTPQAVQRFLEYWHPEVALWVDSEFWPNIIIETKKRGTVMGIVNARISEKSFRAWQYARGFIRPLLSCFTFCFAQSARDGERLAQLGMSAITGIGNLKYDAPPLPYDKKELGQLQADIGNRPVWVAASTHPGEEEIIADVHKNVKAMLADVLTIIVPRHAVRGNEIAARLAGAHIVQRSKGGAIVWDTDIYLADTMGELGLFYKAAAVAFTGGTLVRHGGQNPLEAARMGCAVITGPHFHNFTSVIHEMEREGAIVITTPEELAQTLKQLFMDDGMRVTLSEAARKHVELRGGVIHHIMNELQPYLT